MQSSLEQFVKAAEVFPAAIVIADGQGRIVLVNGQTEMMFGYARDELMGQMIEMLIPERYRDRHTHHRHDYNVAPRTRLMGLGMDLVGRRKNGDEFPIEVSLSPVQTDTGMLIVSMVHDIAARKHAEEERKQSEERYRSLFENAVFGIFRGTPAGDFLGTLWMRTRRFVQCWDMTPLKSFFRTGQHSTFFRTPSNDWPYWKN